ncbi:MAG: hypothetical protein HY820_13660 [Acidobacteria bacterium]|nr:hypothetical protein [Acidobacteriota bacterium]
MKLALSLVLFFAAIGNAQVPRAQGYLVQGFGATAPGGAGIGQTAVGGDIGVYKGAGAGLELAGVYPFRCGTCAIGAFSLGGNYHFNAGRKDTRWDPYVVGGYTLFFRSGVANGYHYGAGIGYWFNRHFGVRAEFRDHRFADAGYPSFRVGLSFQ